MGWIGVDLDGTLAVYDGWKGEDHIGPPVPAMVERVKAWLARGRDVRIYTARISESARGAAGVERMRTRIEAWCEEHIGRALPVTNAKDLKMVECWDDRAVQVIPNTGARADARLQEQERAAALRQQEASAWWATNGARWYLTAPTLEMIDQEGMEAICAILNANGVLAWHGDGTGMIVNLLRALAAQNAALQAERDAVTLDRDQQKEALRQCLLDALKLISERDAALREAEKAERRGMLRAKEILRLTVAASRDADGEVTPHQVCAEAERLIDEAAETVAHQRPEQGRSAEAMRQVKGAAP